MLSNLVCSSPQNVEKLENSVKKIGVMDLSVSYSDHFDSLSVYIACIIQ